MSRQPRPFVVFGFETTHDALAAEDVLREEGLEVTPVPSPKSLGTLCGLAIRVPEAMASSVEGLLARRGIAVAGSVVTQDV